MISVLAQAHTGNPTFDKRLDTALDLVEAGIGHNSAIAIEYIDTPVLKLDKGSARVFRKRYENAAVKIVRRFPVRQRLVIDADNVVLSGGLILIAARRVETETLPVVRVADLSAIEIKALSVAYGHLG